MRESPKNQISRRALTVWRITGFVAGLLFLAAVIGLNVLFAYQEWPMWVIAVLYLLAAVYLFYAAWLVPMLRHRVWRYEIHEHEVDLQYGLFVVRRVIIPMVKVQHVDTKQGPLLKKYGLATVEITTAATKHEIPALGVAEADGLRDFISRLARVTDDDE
ncbi:PH domain-containing protein [Metabacillus sp. GX 13764]|uniref:PH domain-containing protein n=1 Tax=Metabacillus kandeliae TaxID=2900151 RepID=UPI001E61F7C9|nr:PH domain-containing protein [Metabacillus kandeliae]MCD7036703.1 PH domain-containing protein [Metabacillus kandeliae]